MRRFRQVPSFIRCVFGHVRSNRLASAAQDQVVRFVADGAIAFGGPDPWAPLQTGTFRLCFTRFSVKLVLIDWTFGNSTIAFFTVAS